MFPASPSSPTARLRAIRRGAALVAACVSLVACGGEATARGQVAAGATRAAVDSGIAIADAGGRTTRLAAPARRIVSLVPSVTETLLAIGAGDRLVGRTRYDDAPAVRGVPSVGGGLDPSVEAIVALRPDLVLAWQGETRSELAHRLEGLGIPVFTVRLQDTTDVFRGIAALGRLTGRDSAAAAVAASLRRDFDAVRRSVAGRPRPSVLYVVSADPPLVPGRTTFIAQLIGVAGGRSAFDDLTAPWPTVSMEEVVRRRPDVVVLPVGEFRENAVATLRQRAAWRDVDAVRDGRIVTVDADLLNRPGANLGAAARALRDAIHPAAARAADTVAPPIR